MLVNLEPGANVMEVKLDAFWNAYEPMLVTVDGMVTEVNFDALWNAYEPMLVTPAGISMEVKLNAR